MLNLKNKMKNFLIAIFFLWIFLFNYVHSNSFEEEALNENLDLDSDDLILKMKSFFDTYANKLKNNMKGVDKIITPGVSNSQAVYTKNYNLEDFNRQTREFIENLSEIRRRDLKIQRDSKQNNEEKNIDLLTKNKILKSRLSIAENEKSKLQSDYNEKNNQKTLIEKSSKSLVEKKINLLKDDVQKLNLLKNSSKNYDNIINKFDFNKKIFEDEIMIKNGLEQLRSDIFRIKFESEHLQNLNKTQMEFKGKAFLLNELLTNQHSKIENKINKVESEIKNKTESIKHLKNEIHNKYLVYSNLNETINKLHKIQQEYRDVLRDSEETLSRMKSKKAIIQDNIKEKLNRRKMRKRTIESVLYKLEKDLDQYNVDKINVNKYRKDIQNINSNLRTLLNRENMIFKKNKIKI